MATVSSDRNAAPPAPMWVRAVDGLSTVLMWLGGLAVVVLALHITIDLLYRAVVDTRLPGTLEYTTYWWLPAMVFLALAGGQLYEEHLRVTVSLDKARPAVRRLADVLAYVVSCFCIVILIYYAYLGAERSLEVEEVANATTAVLIWPFKLLAVAGLVAFLLQTIVTVVRLLGLAPPSKHDDAAAPIQGEM